MIMEAMRLSLLEHEEQQRREAQNRQREGASSDSANGQPTPASSSALRIPGSLGPSSTVSSLASTPLLVAAPLQDEHLMPPAALSNSNSGSTSHWSIPRNRTPSPSPPVTHSASVANSQSDNTTSWFRRTSNPPPFTTLNAALGAASTARAIIGDGADHVQEGAGDLPQNTTAAANATPNDLVHTEPTSPPLTVAIPSAPPLVPTPNGAPSATLHRAQSLADSVISSDSPYPGPPSSYDVLLSSPESEFSHEPLLGNAHASWDQSRNNSAR
jgi:hypothetical protein